MAANQEPDIARRLGGGANRQGVSGSGEAVAEKLKGAFSSIAENAAKALKSLTDMEKVVNKIDRTTRGSTAFGGAAGGKTNAGGPSFGGVRAAVGSLLGTSGGGGAGGGGGGGGHLNIGGAPSFGGGGGQPGGANVTGRATDGRMPGGNMLTTALGSMGGAGALGSAAFKVAGAYGAAHLGDAATMELASSRLADQGGGNREFWRAGGGLARLGGYGLNDNTAAAMTLSNMGSLANPNDPRFMAMYGQVQQMTNQFGGLGSGSAAQFLQTGRSTQTQYAGRAIGIRTAGPNGAAMSPDQVADQILRQYRGHNVMGSVGYQRDIAAEMEQGAGIDQRINALGYTGEQADILRRSITAKAAGQTVGETNKNPLDSQTKDTAQSQMETTSETAKGIAEGAADIKHGGEMFRDAVNALLRGSHLAGVGGLLSGGASQVGGPRASGAGIAPLRFNDGRQQGGPDDTGFMGIEEAVTKLGIKFGTPDTGQTTGGRHASGSSHYAGLAVDFGSSSSNPGQIAKALLPYATGANAVISELIYSPMGIGMKNGANIGEKGYGAAVWADHRDHVHVAVKPGVKLADVVGGSAGTSTASGGTTGGSDEKASAGGGGGGGITNSAKDLIAEGSTASLLAVASGGGGGGSGSGSKDSSGSGDAGGGATTAGSNATGDMMSNAKTILSVAKEMGLPKQAGVIGIMTALTESGLINLHGGDRDSQGLFQQRPSAGWGTPAQVTNPHYAAQKFFQALKAESGWQTMDPWMAAQGVQRSAFSSGSNYKAKLGQAEGLVNQIGYAQGTWEVERDQYARIHSGEMVVPANSAEQIRRASAGRGPGAPVTINVTLNSASEAETMRLVQRVKSEMQRDSVIDMIGAS